MKENVIIGKLIPAGTGMPDYRGIKPEEIGGSSTDGVYSISELEEKMKAEDAKKSNPTKTTK